MAGGALLLRLLACAFLLFLLPADLMGQELLVSRAVFQGQGERPQKDLPEGGQPVELRDEVWRVPYAARLRVESPNPDTYLVFRFGPGDEDPDTLKLTVVLIHRPGTRHFQIKEASQIMRAGTLVDYKDYLVGEGAETELEAEQGRVSEIIIQDDATTELRLGLRDDTLVIEAIPYEQGGEPSGGAMPHYFGSTLTFMDYFLLGAGYTDNGYGEFILYDHLAVKTNLFFATDVLVLVRGVVQQELLRWSRFSYWLEGGGAYYESSPTDAGDTNIATPIWAFGMTGHYRYGDWGAALHLGMVKDSTTIMMVLGGWQFTKVIGAVIQYQSFNGQSAYGLGATMNVWD